VILPHPDPPQKKGEGDESEKKRNETAATEFSQPVPLSTGEGRGEVKKLTHKKAVIANIFWAIESIKKGVIATQKICGNLPGLKPRSTCSKNTIASE